MTSYQERHAEPRWKAKRDKPSPLRIVKRCRGNRYDDDLAANTSTSIDGSNSDISSITDRTKYLQVFKRRVQHQSPTAHKFWASSVDLRHPQMRPWEEAVARCRGLLRKSTPNIRTCKRYLTGGRSLSSQTESSRRLSSTSSSQPGTSTDCYRSTSTSSYEMEPRTSVDANNLQRHVHYDGSSEPQNSRTTPDQLSPRHISQNPRTSILSPRIVVTPQQEELDGNQSSVWVAVEISGKLSQISPTKLTKATESQNYIVAGTFIDHKLDRFFDFGCLYDLNVEMSAVPGTAIMDVVHEQSWPTTLYAGTSVLIVAHVRLHHTGGPEIGHARSQSNELMEELELQLGNVQTHLMNIRVTYHHSAFPEITNADVPRSGLSCLQSRMETTATASIVRKTGRSVWSPRSQGSHNNLFPLMVQHWGDEKALSVQRRISDSLIISMKKPAFGAVVSGGGMSFDLNEDNASESPGLQRYLLNGNPGNVSIGHMESKRRRVQLTDEPQNMGVKSSGPDGEMYCFGERALRALAPSPVAGENNPSTDGEPSLELKHKDSKFWDWGSWF